MKTCRIALATLTLLFAARSFAAKDPSYLVQLSNVAMKGIYSDREMKDAAIRSVMSKQVEEVWSLTCLTPSMRRTAKAPRCRLVIVQPTQLTAESLTDEPQGGIEFEESKFGSAKKPYKLKFYVSTPVRRLCELEGTHDEKHGDEVKSFRCETKSVQGRGVVIADEAETLTLKLRGRNP